MRSSSLVILILLLLSVSSTYRLRWANPLSPRHQVTSDADGISAGMTLLSLSGAVSPKDCAIFVLSDGYSSRGLRLTATLQDAKARGFTVLGVGLGTNTEQSGFSANYDNFVLCDKMQLLPEAVRSWAAAVGGGRRDG
jgi:hypothetical protein